MEIHFDTDGQCSDVSWAQSLMTGMLTRYSHIISTVQSAVLAQSVHEDDFRLDGSIQQNADTLIRPLHQTESPVEVSNSGVLGGDNAHLALALAIAGVVLVI